MRMDYDDTQLSTTPDRTFGLLTHPTLPPLWRRWRSPNAWACRAAHFWKPS